MREEDMRLAVYAAALAVTLAGQGTQTFGPISVSVPGGVFVFEQVRLQPTQDIRIVNKTGRNWGALRFWITVTGRAPGRAPISKRLYLDISAIYEDETQEFAPDLDVPEVTITNVKIEYGSGYRQPNAADREREAKRAAAAAAAHSAALAKKPKLDTGTASVPVGADRKCLDQAAAAITAEGLEARKRLAELVKYGCVFTVPRLTPVDVMQSEGPRSLVGIAIGPSAGKTGWVMTEWLKGSVPTKKGEKAVI